MCIYLQVCGLCVGEHLIMYVYLRLCVCLCTCLNRRNNRPPEPVQCPVAPTMSRGASLTSLSDRSTG